MIDGNNEHTNILKCDNQRAILVDTLDGALHTLEVATLETYAPSLLSEEHLVVGQQCAPLVRVGYGHSLHEGFHAGSGNSNNGARLRCDGRSKGHVLHVLTVFVIHLQL